MESEADQGPDDFSMLTYPEAEPPAVEDVTPSMVSGPLTATVLDSVNPLPPPLPTPGQHTVIPPEVRLQLFEQEESQVHSQPSEETPPTQVPPVQVEFFHQKNKPSEFQTRQEYDDRDDEKKQPDKDKAKAGTSLAEQFNLADQDSKLAEDSNLVEQDSNLASILALDSVGNSATSAPAAAAYGQKEKYLFTDPDDDGDDGGGEEDPHPDQEKDSPPGREPAVGTRALGDEGGGLAVGGEGDDLVRGEGGDLTLTPSPVAVQKRGDGQVSIRFLPQRSAARADRQSPSGPEEGREPQDVTSDRNQMCTQSDEESDAWRRNTEVTSDADREPSPGPGQADQTTPPVPEDAPGQEEPGPEERKDLWDNDDDDFFLDHRFAPQEKGEAKRSEGDAVDQSIVGWSAFSSDAPAREEGKWDTWPPDSRAENSREGEGDKAEEEREEEEMRRITSDDEGKFSTPTSSPAFNQSAHGISDNAPEENVKNMESAPSPVQQGNWSTPPMMISPSEDNFRGGAGFAQMGPGSQQFRGTPPQRMPSPQLMTHGHQSPNGGGSAFRPVPLWPAGPYDSLQGSPLGWPGPPGLDGRPAASPLPQQTLQGGGRRQSPPSAPVDLSGQRADHSPGLQGHSHSPLPQDARRYPSPSGQQWGPVGAHPSLCQQQLGVATPPLPWQGGPNPARYTPYYQGQQYQQEQYQHYLWQQQQQWQLWQQQQQWAQAQQSGQPWGGTTPASTQGGPLGPNTPDSGYLSPQGPVVGGQPGPTAGERSLGQHPPVSLAPNQAAEGAADLADTVRVSGVDESMDVEMLQYYFESTKKSGGDTVTSIADHRQQGYLLVTFDNPAVVERVVQRSHTVSRRQLTVTAERPQRQEPMAEGGEDFSCTVQVSGGEVALDAEMMELYFENTKTSGGGTTRGIQVLPEAGVTLITFEDREAAEAVVKRTHVVSKTKLTVVPYRPPGAPTKVKVTGLSSKASEELLQFYFEKVGDCDVEEVQMNREKGEAVVTFDSPEAVRTILAQEHHVGGTQVTVTPLTTTTTTTDGDGPGVSSAPQDPCTVEVRGLGSHTLLDTVHYYFENKRRSGGGPVKDVQYQPGSGVARVTFEDAEVVPAVLAKQHTIDKQPLEVALYTPDPSPHADEEISESGQAQQLNTVSVHGLSTSTSEDNILNYFENVRRSGGGDVIEIRRDVKNGVFYVIFKNTDDAARVAARPHTIHKQPVKVQLYQPPEMCKDRILLKNLPEMQSRDELVNFVELKSDKDVKAVLFTEEEGVALVIFYSDVDLHQMQGCLMKKPFKQRSVEVETVPLSCSVLVTVLPRHPPVSQDMLLNYFENTRRSGGENVARVELWAEELSALVTFEDAKVASRVAGRQHTIHNRPITVSLYMECLGVSGGFPDPWAQIPPPLPLSPEQCRTIFSLKVLPERYQELEASLGSLYAGLELDDAGSGCVVCALTSEVQGVGQRVKAWAGDVQGVLQGHLDDVRAEWMPVSEEEQAQAEPGLKEMMAGNLDIGFCFHAERSQLQIVYKGEQCRNMVDKLISAIQETREKLIRQKSEATEQMKLGRPKVLMLQRRPEFERLSGDYPDTCVTCHPDQGLVEVRGPGEDLQEIKVKIYDLTGPIMATSHRWDSDLHKELILQNPAAREFLESVCCGEGPEEMVEFTPQGITVHSYDEQRAESVQMSAVRAVQRRVIPFDADSRSATQLQGWADLKQSVLTRSKGLTVLEEDGSGLTIVSVSQSLQEDFKALKSFLKENSVQQETFPLPRILSQIFNPYLQSRIIELQLSSNSCDFTLDADNDQFVVNGNRQMIDTARGIYTSFRLALKVKRKTYSQPSMKEFFSTLEWQWKQKDILRLHKCLILDPEDIQGSFLDEADVGARSVSPVEEQGQGVDWPAFQGLGAGAPMAPQVPSTSGARPKHPTTSRPQPRPGPAVADDGAANTPVPDLPVRPRLYLSVMSDITKEEHHVLVNSSNTSLNMANGQVSKALLQAGGPAIQEELKASYPKGIGLGNIAVSTGGNLMCKKLIHCCLPQQKDEEQKDEEQKDEEKIDEVVRLAVTKCLTEVEKLGMGSVGFPSLGTGNLGYPAPQVARSMFDAALDYGRQHPNTVISDVFFILHKKDKALTQVFGKEHETYKEQLKASASLRHQEEPAEDYVVPDVNPFSQGIESYPYFQATQGRVKKVWVGTDPDAMDEAEKEMTTMYRDSVGSHTIDVPHLDSWDDLHKNNIVRAAEAVKVDVTLNFSLGKISLHGFKEMLGRIPVHSTLKEAEGDVNMKQNAKLLQQQVQWCTIEIDIDGEHLVPYDMFNNYKIETAYQDGEDKAMIIDGNSNKSLIISFARMEEFPETTNEEENAFDCLGVIRRDKIQTLNVQPPRSWSAMKEDLDVVSLPPSSEEYTSVANTFTTSLKNPSAKIEKIERIQNLTLHKQYQAMKQQMESVVASSDKHCERSRLWHGTKEDAVQGIIKYGFNRSYSDLSKSAYGQGAYFAVSAEYSSRNAYAAASPLTQERNMFMCKVLVGEYLKGSQDMRTPPEISPGKRCHSTVDDVNKPEIFVTYSDVQAYPEYRIVFKDN